MTATRAYIIATGRRISPFGDPVADVLVLNRPLRDHQDEALRAAGLEPARVDRWEDVREFPCLALEDDLYVTRQLLGDFLRLAGGGAARAGLADSEYLKASSPMQDLPEATDGAAKGLAYRLYRLAGPSDRDSRDALPTRLVDPREKTVEVPVPRGFRGGEERRQLAAATTRRAMHVRNWVHLLRVNLDAIAGTFKEAFEERRLRLLLRALLFLLTFPLRNRNRVFSRFGRRCRIHRTAIVEASWLGDGVEIGPFCVIQGAVLGDGVKIAAHSQVALSVLGENTWMTRNAIAFCALVYPDCFVGMPFTQVSVLGRGVTTTSLAGLVDVNFQGDVRILHDGRLVPTGANFLGSALGHGVTMGTRLFLAPGREIPNGYFITGEAEEWIVKVPQGLPTGEPLVVREGALVPRSHVFAPKTPSPA